MIPQTTIAAAGSGIRAEAMIMPMVDVNGTTLYVEDSGGSGEPVVFSHGLLFDTRVFDSQVMALRGRHRCIAYDHRGQGRSAVPDDRSIAIDTLTDDAIALIEDRDVAPCHFVGLSMGGFVGMRVALRRPELLRSLVLIDTSARAQDPSEVPRYNLLKNVARLFGTRVVAGRLMPIFFGPEFRSAAARAGERKMWRRQLGSRKRSVYRAVNGVMEREPILDGIGAIDVPTLVIHGEEDAALDPDEGRLIAQTIPGARLEIIADAGHTPTVERPADVDAALERFLASIADSPDR